VMAKFCELWTTQHPGLNAWLFGEQLGAHIDESIVARSMQQHVFMWFFAANTSHFLQPLHCTPFAVLKKKLKELCTDSLSQALFTKEHKKSLLSSIVFEAIKESFTPEVIKSSFKRTGVWPWDPELIQRNAQENLDSKRSHWSWRSISKLQWMQCNDQGPHRIQDEFKGQD